MKLPFRTLSLVLCPVLVGWLAAGIHASGVVGPPEVVEYQGELYFRAPVPGFVPTSRRRNFHDCRVTAGPAVDVFVLGRVGNSQSPIVVGRLSERADVRIEVPVGEDGGREEATFAL